MYSEPLQNYTLFYCKQPVYKKPVLNSQNHEQLSVLNIVSISNHLKQEKNKEKIKIGASNSILKTDLLRVHFFQLQNQFFLLTLPFYISFRYWGTKIQFQTFCLHSTSVEFFEDLEVNLLCYQSKLFRNFLYMTKFVFSD